MATIDAANALIAGSKDDELVLGPWVEGFADTITGLATEMPSTHIPCGWLSDDGIALAFDDSVTEIKGHQGHGLVKSFMDSSKTSLTAVLLETLLKTFTWYLDATATKVQETVGASQVDIAKIVAPSSRRVIPLCGYVDVFDTSGSGAQTRIVFPKLELGKRGNLEFKTSGITAYQYDLTVVGDFIIYSTAKGLIPAA